MPTAGSSVPPCAGDVGLELDRRTVELRQRLTKPLERRTVMAAAALEEMMDNEADDCVHVGAFNVLDVFKLRVLRDQAAAVILDAEVISEDDAAKADAERERIRSINRPAFAGYKPA